MLDTTVYIAKHNKDGLIKIRHYDSEDYEIIVVKGTETLKRFASRCGGLARAIESAEITTGIEVTELVAMSHKEPLLPAGGEQ